MCWMENFTKSNIHVMPNKRVDKIFCKNSNKSVGSKLLEAIVDMEGSF